MDNFENAKWIWKDTKFTKNDYAYFRKEYRIDKPVEEAFIHVSAHNHMKLYVNGKIVSDFVTPISSVATKRKYYLSYDVKEYLTQGMNCFYLEVLYLGGSGQNYVNAAPGFILSGLIQCENKTIEISSNESWKTTKKIAHGINMPYQQSRHVTPVELFDARLYEEEAKFVSYDDKDWINAITSPMQLQQPILVKQKIAEGSIHQTIYPKKIGKRKKGFQVFDVGRIITGFVRIKLKGYEGKQITIRYSEDLLNHRVKHNVANEQSDYYCDYYIMNDCDEQTWQADFTYKSFRYFEIENYPEELDEHQVIAIVCSTGIEVNGYLSSKSYPILNDLYEVSVNTQLNNTQGMLVDCPHREQAQYLGDSDLQAENLIYNFSNHYELIDKALQDFSDMQQVEGFFPFVAPTNFLDTQFELRICEYDFYFITLMEKAYKINRDKRIIKQYYPIAKKMLAHYLSLIDETGLIPKDKGWHISDWPYPKVDETGHYLTFQNMLALKVLRIMIEFGKLMDESVNYYIKLENQLRFSIVKYLKKDGLFIDSSNSSKKHQGINALALELNLFNEEEKKVALDYIIKQKFASSVILGRTVLRQLFEHEQTEAAFQYMFNNEKGWGNILRLGNKTMWEGFDDIESHSHAWNCYPLRMIQEYVVGLKMIEPTKVYITPQFVNRVSDITAKVQSMYGNITFGYEKYENKVIFTYFIPAGIEAILHFKDKDHVLVNGKLTKIKL